MEEDDKALRYFYYFYPPNYKAIFFEDPELSELKEPVTTLWQMANKEEFSEYKTLEAVLWHYHEDDD